MNRLWVIPLGGALLAPLVTWLPMLVQRFPGVPLPPYQAAPSGIDFWASQVFYLTVFAIVAALVGRQDRWLGCAVLMLGVTIFFWGGTYDLTHSVMFMLGALTLWAMRHMPADKRPLVVACLAASGLFQAVYIIQQTLGYDFFWIDLWGMSAPSVYPEGHAMAGQPFRLRALGTLGTEDAAASYVAITAPLMPLWALPLAAWAVLKGNPEGHSLTAITAFVVGMLVRFHRSWKLTAALTAGVGACALWGMWKIQRWNIPSTALARLDIYKLGLEDLWFTYKIPNLWTHANPVNGNGEWWPRIATLQKQMGRSVTGEVFQQAHNDWLQWVYTYGLLGASILGLWLWEHRLIFAGAFAASLLAASVVALGFFPFHVVPLALLIICLVALATPDSSVEVA